MPLFFCDRQLSVIYFASTRRRLCPSLLFSASVYRARLLLLSGRRTRPESMFCRFFLIQNCAAMPANGHSWLHFFAARRAISHAHGNVGPFAFGAQRNRGAAMEIGNLAEGMSARPHECRHRSPVAGNTHRDAQSPADNSSAGRPRSGADERRRGRASPAADLRQFRAPKS